MYRRDGCRCCSVRIYRDAIEYLFCFPFSFQMFYQSVIVGHFCNKNHTSIRFGLVVLSWTAISPHLHLHGPPIVSSSRNRRNRTPYLHYYPSDKPSGVLHAFVACIFVREFIICRVNLRARYLIFSLVRSALLVWLVVVQGEKDSSSHFPFFPYTGIATQRDNEEDGRLQKGTGRNIQLSIPC